jgi:hypothetical protein
MPEWFTAISHIVALLTHLIPCAIAAMITHEGGHYAAALRFGHKLKFRFAFGKLWKIPVPRYIWTMPEMEPWKQTYVALAGFVTEFASAALCVLAFPGVWKWYLAVVMAHFALYPHYAGKDSDWKWV